MGPMSETKFVTKTLSRDISLISGPALVKVSSGARFVIFRTLPNVANFAKMYLLCNKQSSLLMSHGNSESVDPSSNPEPSANVLTILSQRLKFYYLMTHMVCLTWLQRYCPIIVILSLTPRMINH